MTQEERMSKLAKKMQNIISEFNDLSKKAPKPKPKYDYEEPEEDDLEDAREYIEEEPEEDPTPTFLVRMIEANNHLVDACEAMPISKAKEFKYKKDKDRAKVLYGRTVSIAEEYHKLLERMKNQIGE